VALIVRTSLNNFSKHNGLNYDSAMTKTQLPSNKKFGVFFSIVFILASTYAYWKFKSDLAFFVLIPSAFFALAAFLAPKILNPLNRLWFSLGLLFGKIISPIVLGIIFFVLITPISLLTRFFGRDELKMKKRSVESYWVDRPSPGPSSDTFKNQY
jgi:hypothetical protein